MKKSRLGIPIVFLIILGVVLVLSITVEQEAPIDSGEMPEIQMEYTAPELVMREDKSIYSQDKNSEVDIFNVTVFPPEGIYQTLQFINENINYDVGDYHKDSTDPQVQISLEISGKTFKGTMELRGQSSRRKDQKSYKIKLFDDEGTFEGMQVLNLNKHYSDSLRIRNKLAYDLIEEIDGLVGLRTRFIRLYITEGGHPVDYGLFTLVEQPNKLFLESHGLDENGQLYKVEFFEFLRYQGILEGITDPRYSEDHFNQLLEVRENPDHEKLVALLEQINDPTKNINDIVENHFSKENLLTWIAFNTLLDNYDSNSRNYLLYSPSYSHIWYFIPWDLDKTMRKKEKTHWSFGISNYWGVELFNRFFRDPSNRDALIEKVEELYFMFTPAEMRKRLKDYQPVIEEHMLGSIDYQFYEADIISSRYQYPDINSIDDFWSEYNNLVMLPTENRKRFYRNLERPYPFFIHYEKEPVHTFTWDLAFDMQGDAIIYTLRLSSDIEMSNILLEKETGELILTLDELPDGSRFWSVIATDINGNEQMPFNQISKDGFIYVGVEKIEVRDE